jgi:hypothetical protein
LLVEHPESFVLNAVQDHSSHFFYICCKISIALDSHWVMCFILLISPLNIPICSPCQFAFFEVISRS